MPATTEQDAWLERVLGVAVAATQAAPPDIAAVTRHLEALEPAYLQAVKADGPDRTRLFALMGMVHELIEAGAASRAEAILVQIDKLIAKPGTVEPKPTLTLDTTPLYDVLGSPGRLVAYRKALLAWDTAKKQSHAQLDELQKRIAGTAPSLAKAATVLGQVMGRLDEGLSDAIDAAMTTEDLGLRGRANAKAAEIARAYLMTVNFDPVFRVLDTNPVSPLSLRTTLSGALTEVVSAMPV